MSQLVIYLKKNTSNKAYFWGKIADIAKELPNNGISETKLRTRTIYNEQPGLPIIDPPISNEIR